MKELKSIFVNWITPALVSGLPFLVLIDYVENYLKAICSLRMVVVWIALNLFLTTRLLVLWMDANRKLKDDFTKHLIPIRGSGACIYEPSGEPVCPACNADGKLVVTTVSAPVHNGCQVG